MLAFSILLPLAVTSNAPMIRRLGGAAWQRLHRLAMSPRQQLPFISSCW